MNRVVLALGLVLAGACKDDKPPAQAVEKSDHPKESKPEAQAREAEKLAEKAAVEAAKDADEARAMVERIEAEVAALGREIQSAEEVALAPRTAAEAKAATATLTGLRAKQTELGTRLADAKATAARAARLKGVKIPKECLDNPLAKGCS